MGRAYVADYLIGADQKIPDWPVKTTILGEVITAVRLPTKSWFADVGLSTSDSVLGLLFLFFKNSEADQGTKPSPTLAAELGQI